MKHVSTLRSHMKREYVKGIAGTCRELSFLWKISLSHNFIHYNYTVVQKSTWHTCCVYCAAVNVILYTTEYVIMTLTPAQQTQQAYNRKSKKVYG